LSLAEALILLRLRWQIELLFKLWKSHGQLDLWRTEKPERILCEVYAKLIGLILQHWMLIIGCWHEPHRSLVKAGKAGRSACGHACCHSAGTNRLSWDAPTHSTSNDLRLAAQFA